MRLPSAGTRRRILLFAGALGVAVGACNLAVLRGGKPFAARLGQGEVADCALVLGARVYADGTVSPVLEDRLEIGLRLYREGRARRILVSGDHGSAAYDEVNAMRRWLEARGVPEADIFLDHAGFDTYSSMARARDVFHARRVIVVTQRFHLPRALYIARKLGLEADGAEADLRRYPGALYSETREIASRTRAFLDVATHRVPRHLGPPMPLSGDGRVTRG
jgi:SanA protein